MAEVFKCRLEGIGGFDKTVVLKCILQQHLGNQEFVQMFLDEARVAARLNHPNIVHIFEIGQVDAVPYIAMEYVPGPSLAMVNMRARKAKALHAGHAARIIAGACQGLFHAHNAKDGQGESLELVHRDVSPHNVVISSEGMPKLLDFGAAKTRGRLAVTQHGMLKGKFGYMSPEQLEGSEIDFRSDIFSIGVCLYLSAVGKLPFRGATEIEMIAAGRKALYRRPSEIIPGFPPALEEIIVTALQKDPAQRFPNARAMAERLEAFAASGPHASTSEGLVEWLTDLFPEGLENTGQHEIPPGITPPSAREGSGVAGTSRKTPRPITTSSVARIVNLSKPSVSDDVALDVDPGAMQQMSGTMPGSGSRRNRLVVAGIVGCVLIAGTVGLVMLNSGDSSGTAAARVYLSGAEQMLKEKKIELARNLVERAEAAGATDPELNVQLSRIRDQVDLEEALSDVRKALEAKDPVLALRRAHDVLQHSPDHAEGKRLMEQARNLLPSESAPPSKPEVVKVAAAAPTPPVPKVPASLSVSSNPWGNVFLDGVGQGRAPVKINKIVPGTHVIEVRRSGYSTARREVLLASGGKESLRVSLNRTGSRSTAETDRPEPPEPPETPPATVSQPPPEPVTVAAVTTPPVAPKPDPLPLPPPPPVPDTKPPSNGAATGGSPGSGGGLTKVSPPVAAQPAYKPRLPRTARVRTMSEVLKTFQVIEAEAVRGGARADVARDSTRALSTELGRRMTAADITEVYPLAMYSVIVEEAARGAGTSAIGEKLKNAHASGALKSR